MESTSSLKAKHYSKERFSYLKQLLHEFNITKNDDAKEQVLANLCNFSYDPNNYDHLNQLNFIPFLLDILENSNKTLVQFAIKGLCNLLPEPHNANIVLSYDGYRKIVRCLLETDEEIIIPTLCILIYLEIRPTSEIIQQINHLRNHEDKRIINLIAILEGL